jgi:hypothetical protein
MQMVRPALWVHLLIASILQDIATAPKTQLTPLVFAVEVVRKIKTVMEYVIRKK